MKRTRLPVVPLQKPGKRPKAASEAERRKRLVEATQKYLLTPRGRYTAQKRQAKQRGIPFLLTFDQWWKIWQESGHYNERGNKTPDQYVMGRFGDEGPYADGNVRIIRHGDNVAERNQVQAARQRRRKYRFSAADRTEAWLHVHSAADAD